MKVMQVRSANGILRINLEVDNVEYTRTSYNVVGDTVKHIVNWEHWCDNRLVPVANEKVEQLEQKFQQL